MKRTFAFLAFAILSCGVAVAQEQGAITVAPSGSIAADKMKLEAESFFLMQDPQSLFIASGPVKGAPFTAQQISESTGTLRDGTHLSRTTTISFARDAEGRTRRETENTITIMDPVANVSYSLNKKTHTAIKLDLKIGLTMTGDKFFFDTTPAVVIRDDVKDKVAAEIKLKEATASSTVIADAPGGNFFYQRSPQSQGTEESLGAQTMEGVSAIGKRTTITVPVTPEFGNDQPIKVVEEQWYSPDLQINIISRSDDPRRTTQTTERYTNIKRGDPNPSLFQVPPDFTVINKKTQQ